MCLFNKLALSEPHGGLIDACEGNGNSPGARTLKMQCVSRQEMKRALSVLGRFKMTPLMSGLGHKISAQPSGTNIQSLIFTPSPLQIYLVRSGLKAMAHTPEAAEGPPDSRLSWGIQYHGFGWKKQRFVGAGTLPPEHHSLAGMEWCLSGCPQTDTPSVFSLFKELGNFVECKYCPERTGLQQSLDEGRCLYSHV